MCFRRCFKRVFFLSKGTKSLVLEHGERARLHARTKTLSAARGKNGVGGVDTAELNENSGRFSHHEFIFHEKSIFAILSPSYTRHLD